MSINNAERGKIAPFLGDHFVASFIKSVAGVYFLFDSYIKEYLFIFFITMTLVEIIKSATGVPTSIDMLSLSNEKW